MKYRFGCTLLHTIELNLKWDIAPCMLSTTSIDFIQLLSNNFLQHNSVGKVCEIDTVRKKLRFSCNIFWHAFHSNVGKPSLSLQFTEKATARKKRKIFSEPILMHQICSKSTLLSFSLTRWAEDKKANLFIHIHIGSGIRQECFMCLAKNGANYDTQEQRICKQGFNL